MQNNEMIYGETTVDMGAKPEQPKPQFFENMSMEEYHSFGKIKRMPDNYVLSKSMLHELVDCPARFKHKYIDEVEQDEKDHLNIGCAVHTLALEPHKFSSLYYQIPEGVKRDKRTAAYKDCITEARGRTMLTAKDYQKVDGMAKALAADPLARALLDGPGYIESSIFYQCPSTGLRKRVRPDWFRKDGKLVVNIKTTHSAKPELFYKTGFDFCYDMGAAMELEAMDLLFGPDPDRNYVLLIIEPDPPHIIGAFDVVRPMMLGDDAYNTSVSYRDVGKSRLEKALFKFQDCMKTGIWPGYTQGVQPMRIPAWKMKSFLEKGE